MTRKEERTANKVFAIMGIPCFADTYVQADSSVLRMKFNAKNPRHRQVPNCFCTRFTPDSSFVGMTKGIETAKPDNKK